MTQVKRVYDQAVAADGARFFVDRLWLRGIKKSALVIQSWLKDASPSNELRNWYHRNLAQWDEFRSHYFAELMANPDAWLPLLEATRRGAVTLLYSSKHTEHNNAVALKEFLSERLHEKRTL